MRMPLFDGSKPSPVAQRTWSEWRGFCQHGRRFFPPQSIRSFRHNFFIKRLQYKLFVL